MLIYLDTSAALKLLIEENESSHLAAYLDGLEQSCTLVSSTLLYAELHCAAARRSAGLNSATIDEVVRSLTLMDLERADLWRAARSNWGLRSADAIHLATALRAETDVMLVYDKKLRTSAENNGLTTASPGT